MIVPLTTQDFLARGATVYPDRVAVVDEPEQPAGSVGELTFAEVQARARAVAAGLDAMGVAAGERIAVVSQNSARMLDLFYGATGSGRIVVPINFRLGRDEVDYIVRHSEASLLLVDPELELPLAAVRAPRRLTLGSESDAALLRFGVEPRPWNDVDENATATINYTSGTTARPKGVELTHRSIWLNATVIALHLGVTDRDVYLHSVPMFHVNGWSLPFSLAALGVPQVVLRKVDGPEILRRIARHGVTLLGGAPAVLDIALNAASHGASTGANRVRVVTGGAPPPTRTIARAEQELGWEVIQIYGLTETSPLLVSNRARTEDVAAGDDERHRRLTRAGAPALGVTLRVAPDGEILARSNHVLKGYWRQPDATAQALAGGWLHTGDGGQLQDGYLSVHDRKKDVIITGGENVSSIEVENRLRSHPAVADVAVIAVPDLKWGETVKAVVVPAPAAQVTAAELIAHARDGLARYKCPTSVDFVDALPRTTTGKVQKFLLRERYWPDHDRQVA
ncbi:MAG TPA: AMP-binding protein [Acidimicrobiia bacterium]|nr:AMP-binding protein [Acidimicrobiia bacterium]